MAPAWHQSDGPSLLFVEIITDSILYALGLSILIILARLLAVIPRKYAGYTIETAYKAWALLSTWLIVAHAFATYAFYDKDTALSRILSWAMIAVAALTIGMGFAGALVALAVVVCYRYL
ncbi:hypothetical protein CAC42_7195 [Sphaceloma murrayae]|uniref:Uncharacterized protein n=1 Tax=Sphaceloma murrayae TaxID=2082308 RepID=A0A2K1QQ43_9PEZI|nr:hypothetical protein CAC42_7195 [Sphaceloma murrayae]